MIFYTSQFSEGMVLHYVNGLGWQQLLADLIHPTKPGDNAPNDTFYVLLIRRYKQIYDVVMGV